MWWEPEPDSEGVRPTLALRSQLSLQDARPSSGPSGVSVLGLFQAKVCVTQGKLTYLVALSLTDFPDFIVEVGDWLRVA